MNRKKEGIEEKAIQKVNKKAKIMVPLIIMLVLVSMVIITMVIGKGKPTEISQKLNEMIQKILPATGDVGATGIGENVIANFVASTGEIHIYSTNPTTPGAIDKSLLMTFYGKCGAENIKSITFDNEVNAPENSESLFRYNTTSLTKLVTINAQNLNTSQVTNMANMFYGCSSLTGIQGINGWDTSKVTDMNHMFRGCSNLTSVKDLSNWDVSNVIDMNYMFYVCRSLRSVENLSNWDVSNVTNIGGMFSNCSNLTSIEGISNWNTNNVTNLSGIFENCQTLTEINLSSWEKSNVTNISYMFSGCSNLSKIEGISEWNTTNVTDMSKMFSGCTSINSLDLRNWDTSNVTSMFYMFSNCTSINSLDLGNWNVSKVTSMSGMFSDCSNITEVGQIKNWETSNLTEVTNMFNGCTSLEEIDLSDWNMTRVKSVEKMFMNCSSLKKITLDNWYVKGFTSYLFWINTGNPIDVVQANGWTLGSVSVKMFAETQVVKLEARDWVLEGLSDLSEIFKYCRNLEEILYMDSWDLSRVTSLERAFQGCTALRCASLVFIDAKVRTGMSACFRDCLSLERLSIRGRIFIYGWDYGELR